VGPFDSPRERGGSLRTGRWVDGQRLAEVGQDGRIRDREKDFFFVIFVFFVNFVVTAAAICE